MPTRILASTHWISSETGAFERVTESRRPSPDKPWLYRSLYGLGCAVHASVVRRGQLIGGKVGIVPVHDHIYTLRCTDEKPALLAPSDAGMSSPLGWTSELFLREFRP